MTITYEIRTRRDAPVFSYDTLERAKQERVRYEKRIGVPLKIIKITHVEEAID
jgi:hypothetical protein